jgi:hypothetical protein
MQSKPRNKEKGERKTPKNDYKKKLRKKKKTPVIIIIMVVVLLAPPTHLKIQPYNPLALQVGHLTGLIGCWPGKVCKLPEGGSCLGNRRGGEGKGGEENLGGQRWLLHQELCFFFPIFAPRWWFEICIWKQQVFVMGVLTLLEENF